MAIPAYLWLKDDGGALVNGSVDVQGRDGSIEVVSFGHSMYLPTDGHTGKITGNRIHSPMRLEKDFDRSSPFLYRAVAEGQKLHSAEIKWYQINHAGQEVEYFNMLLEGVHIVSIAPFMQNYRTSGAQFQNHMESVELRYEKITWKYCDGNLTFNDSWDKR